MKTWFGVRLQDDEHEKAQGLQPLGFYVVRIKLFCSFYRNYLNGSSFAGVAGAGGV
jgi:hypothetical protein